MRLSPMQAIALGQPKRIVCHGIAASLPSDRAEDLAPHGDRSTIDLVADRGPARLGVYDIVGSSLRLNLGAPGAARPAALEGARVYTTP